MSFNEALNPAPFQPLPGYFTYLNNLAIPGSTAATASYESSACLLMALQRGVSGAGIDPSDLTAGGAASSLISPNGGSLPYLTDAWERPIFFTRAPAGNLYLNPISTHPNTYPMPSGMTVTCYSQPGANDPGDPQGYLQTGLWGKTYGPAFFALTLQVVPTQQPNTSFKLAPMLGSGGPTDWTKPGQSLPFDPITFFTVPGSDALFSTP